MARHMTEKRAIIDDKAKGPSRRTWGLSRHVWLLLACFCAFAEFAGSFATNSRISGWGDVAFIVVFAVVGVAALINALRLTRRVG